MQPSCAERVPSGVPNWAKLVASRDTRAPPNARLERRVALAVRLQRRARRLDSGRRFFLRAGRAGSRILALLAAALVLAAVGLLWFTALDERDAAASKSPSAVALHWAGSGRVVCGALSLEGGRASITPKGGTATPVPDTSRLIIVSACP